MVGAQLVILIVYFAPSVFFEGQDISPLAAVPLSFAAAAFSAAQWLWLRYRIKNSHWWIPATILSWWLAIFFELLQRRWDDHHRLDSRPQLILHPRNSISSKRRTGTLTSNRSNGCRRSKF
jgi:hypothetical protein